MRHYASSSPDGETRVPAGGRAPVAQIQIVAKDGGYYLLRSSETGEPLRDSWFPTLGEALAEAELEFAVTEQDWHAPEPYPEGIRGALALASDRPFWSLRAYTATRRTLALWTRPVGPGYSPGGYLAFHRPSRVRLPGAFGRAEFALAGPEAPEGTEGSPRSGTLSVAIRTEDQEYSVVCEGVTFNPRRSMPGLAINIADSGLNADYQVHLLGPGSVDFSALDGAKLEWWMYVDSLQQFRLLASELTGGVAEIRFLGAGYLDMPMVMHRARLRAPTEAERAALRAQLGEQEVGVWQGNAHMVIDCEEGTFNLRASHLATRWMKGPDFSTLEAIDHIAW